MLPNMRLLTLLTAAAVLACPLSAQEDTPAPAAPSQELAEGWDFVPGERQILYDDFTDMVKGGAPPHWKVRGASVKLGTDGRLIVSQDVDLYPNVTAWPKNFTLEQDVAIHKSPSSDLEWHFADAEGAEQWRMWIRFDEAGQSCAAHLDGAEGTLGEAECKYVPGASGALNLWMQDGRIRVYWNRDRLIDVNQVQSAQLGKVWMHTALDEGAFFTLGRLRIAESAPDISQTILATGRYVSHGIQFDVNSDRLKPESMAVIKEIAAALKKQPSLKVRIEGHTDSTGDAARNMDLSKRRADAVKAALVTSFGVSAERLTTQGFGATKPIGSNDTPDGRANNRRVEFVKI
jgi:OOP family OmpA-OmpF porin